VIDLTQRLQPYEIALPYGLTVTVKTLTTAATATAQGGAWSATRSERATTWYKLLPKA
jgi:hypothetical protein